jgi:hypothetical protein
MIGLALKYARYGVMVFPCFGAGPRTKQPMVSGGFQAASADEAVVKAWWPQWHKGVVGLPCRPNDIIVLDGDRHGGGVDGVAMLHGVFAEIGFDRLSVPAVATPNNGEHYYFRRPQGLGSVAAKLVPGVDVRDNAYVIAAGSVFLDKRQYRLVNGTPKQLAEAIQTKTLPELPAAIVERLVKPASTFEPRFFPPRQSSKAILLRLEGLIETIATARPGERNTVLHWAACRCGEMVRDGHISEETGFVALATVARMIGLPDKEASATIRSGLRHG